MSHPLAVGICIGAMLTGVVLGACTVVTTLWCERVYLKRQP